MNLEITAVRADSFAPYGEVVPAGSVEEHMMDARIYGVLHDGDAICAPRLRQFRAQPLQRPFALHCLQRFRTSRCLCLPDRGSHQLIVVARHGDDGPQDIRAFAFAGHLALNLRENVWFGAFTPLREAAQATIIEFSATPVETLVLAAPLRIGRGFGFDAAEREARSRSEGSAGNRTPG